MMEGFAVREQTAFTPGIATLADALMANSIGKASTEASNSKAA
jgi:hypothetical protein